MTYFTLPFHSEGPSTAVSGEGTSPSGPSGWRCLTSTIFVDAIDTVRRKCCCPVRTGSLAGAARAGLPGSPGGCSAALWLGRFVARACRLGLVRRGRSCPASSRSVSEGVLGHADAEACLPGSAAEGEEDVGVFGRRVVRWERRRLLAGYQDSAGCVGECVSGGDKGNRPRTRSHSPRSHGSPRPSRTRPGPGTFGCRRPHQDRQNCGIIQRGSATKRLDQNQGETCKDSLEGL